MFIATSDGSLISLDDIHTIGPVPDRNMIIARRRNLEEFEGMERIIISTDAEKDWSYIRRQLELTGNLVNWVDPVDDEDAVLGIFEPA
ncbi:hypothetical protein KKH23_07965 [Patescibacteria group bacterium]|nr:hypothetical protein [Patescibacteria group bacterium]